MKSQLLNCCISLLCLLFLQANSLFAQDVDAYTINLEVKEQLIVPFGTVVEVEVEIVDGLDLQRKALQGAFLINITKVDTTILSKPIILNFKDKTRKFPNDDFGLYEFLHGEKARWLDSKTMKEMKQSYVG